jgi:4-amino-4-deoxy-L-arabinose transferase-like glycosyltransferase/membrane-associated phospholipid phosphatase
MDQTIYLFLSQASLVDFFRPVSLILNKLGKGDVLAFCCILLLIRGYLVGQWHNIKTAVSALSALAFSGILVQTLKQLIGRARPQMNLGDLYFIGPNWFQDGFDSMPSGHTIASFTLATFFSYYYPRWKGLLFTLAGAIGILGRVLASYHFLSDVVIGAALGILVGWGCAKGWEGWIQASPQKSQELLHPPMDQGKGRWNGLPFKNWKIDFLFVFLFSGVILFTGITQSALWDRDETEYAQATIEMQQNQEWLIPTLEGKPFLEKPILMYWCTRISILLFGANEFGFRFPSVLFGILTCLVTYGLAQKLWGGKGGLLSSLILSTSFLFIGGFKLLITDPLLVFFSVLALFFYVGSMEEPKKKGMWLGATYLAIGFGVLSKGLIGFFPALLFVVFEWILKKRWRVMMPHLAFSLIPLFIAGPWFFYSFSTQSQATSSFFIYDHLTRFITGMEGHTGPMVYHVISLFFGFFPWSLFLWPYFKKEWNQRKAWEPKTLLLTLWSLAIFLFFSVSANKLPHYMLLALPPLACLVGKFWSEGSEGGEGGVGVDPSGFKWILGITTLFLMGSISVYWIRPQYASVALILPFAVLIILISVAYFLSLKKYVLGGFFGLVLAVLCFVSTFSVWALPWVEKHRVMKPIGLAIKNIPESHATVFGYHISEPSLFIYGERTFPKLEDIPLASILKSTDVVYGVITEDQLNQQKIQTPYTLVAKKQGFAENNGEMTLLLIRN